MKKCINLKYMSYLLFESLLARTFSILLLIVLSQMNIFAQFPESMSLDEQRRILESAQMSLESYKETISNSIYKDLEMNPIGDEQNGYWEKISQGYMKSGLNWSLFQRKLPNGKIEQTLAFGGTEFFNRASKTKHIDIRDIWTDIIQGVGILPRQYKDAIDVTNHYIEKAKINPDLSISVAGHSLGGSIAQFVGYTLGIMAYVFNSAPLVAHYCEIKKEENLFKTVNVYNKADVFHSLPGAQLGKMYPLDHSPETIDKF